VRLLHLSDLHLGFRQYQRLTPAGINQREADVALAFRRALDRAIEIRPDVILLAGDIFHNVRPSNPAILDAFQQFSRLTRALPEAAIIMVAGNHDTPRAAETGCILRLFTPLGIHVVDSEPRRIRIPERNLSVLAVPDLPGARIAYTPDPDARYNVLLLHGEIEGVIPRSSSDERAGLEIPREALGVARWDYVALGHYHVHREVAPNAFYSGSVEYTSANPWGELLEQREAKLAGKGMVEYDLDRRAPAFHHLPASRALVDLATFSARGMAAADVDRMIAEAVGACVDGIDDKIVRLVVRDLPRHIARDLDHQALRGYKRRALHFLLDTRRPEIIRVHGHGAPGRRPSLADTVREKLQSRLLESDIDREALVSLGLRYLQEAEAATQTAPDPREASV
jgi:DNA repair exonuclease SbcCD nuclease subunit